MSEPKVAPTEKPRYMNDALSERITGAPLSPMMPISRDCCAGKKPQAAAPQTITAAIDGQQCLGWVR